MAANFKNLLDKGIASVTVKSSSFLETSKLSNQINILQGEIPTQKQLMGEAAYAAWQAGASADEVIIPYCEAVKAREAQIAELAHKIEEIKEESQKLLGVEATAAPATSAAPGSRVFCSACGAENAGIAKFCCKCGNKL